MFTEGSVTPQNVRKWAVDIVTRLRSLAEIRDEMKQFKLVHMYVIMIIQHCSLHYLSSRLMHEK